MATAQKPRITLGGLSPLLDINELDDAPAPAARSEEAPRMALDLIDEDPNQPRTEFDPEELQALAENIKVSGGVKSPVSLRPHPTEPGRYMLNFGARRLRASRMLGLADIPYFIDRQVDSFDQVAENDQREGLTAMELALFIKARMAEGMTQREIGRRLGRSEGFISRATALIDAPDCVTAAYREGRLRGGTEAYELRKLHAQNPAAVDQWTANAQEVTRTTLAELKQQLAEPAVTVSAQEPAAPAPAAPAPTKPPTVNTAGQAAKPAPAALVLVGEYKGQPLELDLSSRPAADGQLFGRRPGSTRRLTVPAAEVRLVGFASL